MADISLDQVRQKYPQYGDMSDEHLAQGLHTKFYSDMPFDAFASKIGYAPQQQPGFFHRSAEALGTGLAQSVRDVAAAGPALAGEKAPSFQEPTDDYAQPVEWGDFVRPGRAVPKVLYGLGRSAPQLAGGIAGGMAGAALGGESGALAGTLVEPGGGTLIGGALGGAGGALAGGAFGTGLATMAQSLGPAYVRAIHENGGDSDKAFNAALEHAGTEGLFSGAAWAALGAAPFKSQMKNLLFQAFGVQPAIGVAQHATQNVEEGKPALEGAADVIPGAIAGTAVPAIGHAALSRLAGAHAPLPGQPAAPPVAEPAAVVPEGAAAPAAAKPPPAQEPPAPTIPPLPPGARPLETLEAMAAGAKPPPPTPAPAPPPESKPPPAEESKQPAFPQEPPAPAPANRPEIPQSPAVIPAAPAADQAPANRPVPSAPARIRTIQQIMDQDGISAPKAKAVQQTEIEAIGRPITEEERQARAAGVAAAPPAANQGTELAKRQGNSVPAPVNDQNAARTPQEQIRPDLAPAIASAETPYAAVPKEPTRLTQFLRSIGGVQDPGGDVRSTLGGAKYRPGLISKTGRTLDDAALLAWENGYFPQHGEDRPTINDLLAAVDDDVRGRPVYSHQDIDAADAYNAAVERNGEVDRLASQHDIDPSGLTREQFYAAVAKRMPAPEVERDHEAMAHQDAYRQFERGARQWADQSGEPWRPADFYEGNQARSLEDLEREDQQANASLAAPERARGDAQPLPAGSPEGAGEEGGGPRGGGAGAGPGLEDIQGLEQRRINVAGQGDIFGGGTEPRAPREAEPTIRNDKRQDVLPGMEPSARQAQAARDQAGPRSDQRAADEGLFAPRREEAQQEALFGPKPEGAPAESVFAAPGLQDRLADFPPYQPHEAHAVASDWVVAKGRETGHEYIAVVRNDRGHVIQAGTFGLVDQVGVGVEKMGGQVDMVTIHHNHPGASALSKTDIMILATPAISHIVAHTPDGHTYIAAIGDKYRQSRADESYANMRLKNTLFAELGKAEARMQGVLQAAVRMGDVSAAQANEMTNDIMMRLAHSRGVIDYQSTRRLPEAVTDRLRTSIVIGGRGVDDGRSTGAIRPEDRVAGLPGPASDRPGRQAPGGAAGDQGRGALPPGSRQARLLESSSLRDAAQEAAMGALREEAARLPDLKPDEERRIGPLRSAILGVMDRARDVGSAVQQMLAPMSTGTKRAQAFAADFANAMRQVSFRYGSIDKELTRNFSPKDREAMGRALDAQSVHEQQTRDLPAAEQEAARAAFEAGKTGIGSLPADQQRALHLLDRLSQDVWRRMQERGMVAPNARPIPWYFSRQILMHDEEGISRPGGGKGGGNRGLEPIGRNLTTAGPMRREHLTPEETEAAAKKALGSGATLLRDIRSLVSKLQQNERAIGGVDLMNKIDEVGKSTGVNLVLKGDIPGLLHPGDYFTIADHPSFRQFAGAGWKAIHVSREFEGPLKAVLSKAPDAWYRGAMQIKGGVMSAIMYSPFIHLAVELGRALPVMPGKVLSLSALRDGSRLRRDLDYMDTATRDGLAPLGHRWAADPVSIADQANPENRGKFATMLGNARDAVANAAGKIGGDFLHDVVQHPHQALLWDQVFNLQVGIYNTLRDKWVAKGFDPALAGAAAAHMANRYAGALPVENLSRGANMAANLLLFSRSFTLGNLGVMKDMMTGAPSHVLARMEQLAGPAQAKAMQSVLRRKAMAAFTLDIGLFYMANGLLQAGIQAMRQGPQAAADDWQKKAMEALSETAGGNPLAIFGVLPQHWNEPGRENRIYAGTDEDGKGIYLRLPAGKVGEEFVGWMSKPGTMLEDKMSPLVRPLIELVMGHDSLGRQLLPPHPKTIGDYVDTAGAIVEHIASNLGPTSTIQGVADMARSALTGQKQQGDSGVTLAKVLGPMTGLAQISGGRPGGPVAGEIAAQAETSRYNVAAAMPSIRRKIVNGDTQGAVADMTALGVAPGLIRYYVEQTLHPHATKGQIQGFTRTSSPEEKARIGMISQ